MQIKSKEENEFEKEKRDKAGKSKKQGSDSDLRLLSSL